MMKDEAPFLLEWFAHHLAVGFTDILVYTNDCTDGTDDMLIRLEELGLGYHRRNDIPEGIKPQPSALKYAQQEPVVQAADWVLVFDADEFLCIRYGDGTLDDMITAAGDANGIVITWRTFGSGHVVDWSRDPVTEQYLYAAPANWNKGWGVKTLFKFDPEYWKLGIHRPSIKNKHLEDGFPDTVKWLNGSGKPMEEYFKFRGWRSIRRTVGYEWAQMNHYAVKSVDSYAVRKLRGNVNNKKDKYNSDYWALQNRNETRDETILRHSAKRAEIMAELLKDPVLSKLHYAALERVEAKLDEYRQTDAYKEMVKGLEEASKIPITQVSAKPPKARDPEKIAALMSDVEEKSGKKAKEKRAKDKAEGIVDRGPSEPLYAPFPIDRSVEIPIERVENHEVMLAVDARVMNPDALEAAAAGKFDRKAARWTPRLIPEDAKRVLNIGSGIGFIPVHICKCFPEVQVLAQENRADLCEIAREVAAENGFDGDARLQITGDALFASADKGGAATGLAGLLDSFKPDVLRVDDEALTAEVLAAAPLAALRRVILSDGVLSRYRKQETAVAKAIMGQRFTEVEELATSGARVFDRA
ncbi:glycosyltransferase family 2 protein [Pseudoruegeria sp. SHC-113]|uniref:glycosyltransferase family 2 protein n=1 Tax=Pseudoruegeria sp. SHC-113 TaxID=2855439 RepID=UPI0021BB65EA|nr:glycosyltransferase family 2 protein [Pseudoruegeria sp. SHC-113]MCT8161641.1 glycosyltransferase family 2 protein [Pseudoruegeria sp. SHC-113]